MKQRWHKLLLVKPKSAIGVSMLDVISNALASIILLFFVLVALRALPPPPERVLGILVVDYKMTWNSPAGPPERIPDMEIYLRGPALNKVPPELRHGPRIEYLGDGEAFTTESVDGIRGVWDGAKVLSKHGPGFLWKRVYYFNPECPSDAETKCEWLAGAYYVNDENFFDTGFPKLQDSAKLEIQAWFLKGGNERHLKPKEVASPRPAHFPSQISATLEFVIPTYESVAPN